MSNLSKAFFQGNSVDMHEVALSLKNKIDIELLNYLQDESDFIGMEDEFNKQYENEGYSISYQQDGIFTVNQSQRILRKPNPNALKEAAKEIKRLTSIEPSEDFMQKIENTKKSNSHKKILKLEDKIKKIRKEIENESKSLVGKNFKISKTYKEWLKVHLDSCFGEDKKDPEYQMAVSIIKGKVSKGKILNVRYDKSDGHTLEIQFDNGAKRLVGLKDIILIDNNKYL